MFIATCAPLIVYLNPCKVRFQEVNTIIYLSIQCIDRWQSLLGKEQACTSLKRQKLVVLQVSWISLSKRHGGVARSAGRLDCGAVIKTI